MLEIIDEVGIQSIEKHEYLRRYIEISRGVRKKWQPPEGAGSTCIDLFCASGKCRIRETGKVIDGSPLVAWKASRDHAPFTQMFIADSDAAKRQAAAERLRAEGAPVIEVKGDALRAIGRIVSRLDPHGLHFAFLDPYSLGALDFRIIEQLSTLKRIDIMIHISKMDMQRNLSMNLREERDGFDLFAPGWREHVDAGLSDQHKLRAQVVEYWRHKIASLNIWPSARMQLVTASGGQHLYWLTLASRHKLADDFWKKAADISQRSFDF